MKKLLAILLVITLLFGVLYSCELLPIPPQPDGPGNSVTPGGNDPGANDPSDPDSPSNPNDPENPDAPEDPSNPNDPDTPDGPIDPEDKVCKTKADHADSDKNGICDKCSDSVIVILDIYAINDLHGKIFDTDSQIGVDELTTYLRGASVRDEQHIFISSGDMWQGSAESNITKGALVTDWMSSLGFVSMTLGNHEFDWGEEFISANAAIAEFPFLAINIYERDTNTRVDYCAPSVVVDRGDLRIGVIGAIGDCYSSISSERVEDVYFKTGSELDSLVIAESERLRREEQVDIVIYSIHDGYIGNSTLTSGGYVDVVFEGHTHQKYVNVDAYDVYHLQNGGENGQGISHVEMKVNFVTDSVSVNTAEIVPTSKYSSLTPDPLIDELSKKYASEIGDAFGKVGYNSRYLDDSELEDLTARLYYELGVKEWGDEYDIVLGGGFLKTRSPYNLAAGEVTYSDLMMLMPFDNQIVLCSIKGSDLKRKFFETSNYDYHIYYEAYGKEVWNSIESNKTYYIVVDSYTSQYKYNNLTVVETYDSTVFARDLLADYIRNGGLE